MLKRITKKISSNAKLYKAELADKGISSFLTARIIKFPATRYLYNLSKPTTVRVGNHTMYIDKNDMVVSQMLYAEHGWDFFTSEVFIKQVKKGGVVLDIGAHIGYYTLLAAEAVGNKGSVYAFEPDPKSFSLLEKNIAVNNYTNVTPVPYAVSDKNASSRLYINRENNTGDNKLINDGTQKKSISIRTVTLDTYAPDLKVDLIKMDIQGAELRALNGMKHLLKRNPRVKLLIEFWPSGLKTAGTDAKALLTFLEKMNFQFILIDEENRSTEKITKTALLKKTTEGSLYDANLLCYRG